MAAMAGGRGKETKQAAEEVVAGQPQRRRKRLEEAIEKAVGRAEVKTAGAGKKVESRLEFLSKMYAANKTKKAVRTKEVKEVKKVKLAKTRKTKEDSDTTKGE